MVPLLQLALEAQGGLANWRQVKSIAFDLSIGGLLWHAKGHPEGLNVALNVEPRKMLVIISPFDGKGSTGYFTPDRVWIEDLDANTLQQLSDPRASFQGHDQMTPWSKLQELYFVGYGFLDYMVTPFLLAENGFKVTEIEPHDENGEIWRRLKVRYPESYPTHSTNQTFYFNQQGLLKRLDYVVQILGGGDDPGVIHNCLDYQAVIGIMFPTYRRVLKRKTDGEPDLSIPPVVEVKISNLRIDSTNCLVR